ncbi:DUF6113 family protein [Actinoallomurus iriomotensis]|uniref:Integral membrane protein n=1 Tax=Actinoallomurus iriomotensis TaxID=478107 RepID=A0A9W6RZP7_9ACTN|nr:DUF6113 family protein [Actinoallomurus iriomotensis]GLY84754.1 hypothetical protein Airi02_026830 [Actinoallomurus iriomotensis]
MEQTTGPYPPPEHTPEPAFLTGLTYGVLFVLGVVLGLIGSFQFSWEVGSVPVAAIALSLVNLAVFRAAGWAMESRLGAVVPAVPWLVILVVLSSRRPEGDLVVTGTAAGYVYMLGGAVAALIAIVWTRSARPWMLTGAPRPPDPR